MRMPTVIDAARAIREGKLTSEALMKACLAAIAQHNPALNAFVYLDADAALASAQAVDRAIAAGRGEQLGALAGVPFGVKDLEDCAGMPTTRGSRWFAGQPPVAADDIHVARLRAAGAIPLGKTACPEFGAWAYTASPTLGVTRNPWNCACTSGGSSGGSSAVCSNVVTVYGTFRLQDCRARPVGGLTVQFHAIPSFCLFDNCRYDWNFGGSGSGFSQRTARPLFTYDLPGTYTAFLDASTDDGARTAACRVEVTVP